MTTPDTPKRTDRTSSAELRRRERMEDREDRFDLAQRFIDGLERAADKLGRHLAITARYLFEAAKASGPAFEPSRSKERFWQDVALTSVTNATTPGTEAQYAAIVATTLVEKYTEWLAAQTPPVPEKIVFDVVLVNNGTNRIQVIKAIREATGLGLKETKDLTESLPAVVKKGLLQVEAEALAHRLREAGAATDVV